MSGASAVRSAAWLLAITLVGCGARTSLDPDPEQEPVDASVDTTDTFIAPDTFVDTFEEPDAPEDVSPDVMIPDTDVPPDAEDTAPDAVVPLLCESDRDCGDDTVCGRDPSVDPVDLAPMRLSCLDTVGTVRTECRAAEDCDRGICAAIGICLEPCATDRDCRADERCQSVFARTGPAEMQPVNSCTRVYAVPADVETERETFAIPRRRQFPIALPAARAGTTVYIAEVGSRFGVVDRLEVLGGATLFDSMSGDPILNPVGAFGSAFAIQVPTGPRVPRGEYIATTTFADRVASEGELHVLRRRSRGTRLNVNFIFVNRRYRAAAPGLRFSRALDEIEETYDFVRIGDVRYVDIVGSLQSLYTIIPLTEDVGAQRLGELFALSAGALEPAVNIFVIRIADGALGVAGGIPGTVGMHGTSSSGVAVSMESLDEDPVRDLYTLGRVLGHEVGHFLGLPHTSELDGSNRDPFPDTPACGLERDVDGDGFLIPDECEGAGADHMMFWAATGDEVSDGQRDILSRAVVLE